MASVRFWRLPRGPARASRSYQEASRTTTRLIFGFGPAFRPVTTAMPVWFVLGFVTVMICSLLSGVLGCIHGSIAGAGRA